MKITITAKTKTEAAEEQSNRYSVELTIQTGVLIRGETHVSSVTKVEYDKYRLGQTLFEG